MVGFSHCAACGVKLGRVTLFCPRCGRPCCSSACRAGHQARECAGRRPTAEAESRRVSPRPTAAASNS